MGLHKRFRILYLIYLETSFRRGGPIIICHMKFMNPNPKPRKRGSIYMLSFFPLIWSVGHSWLVFKPITRQRSSTRDVNLSVLVWVHGGPGSLMRKWNQFPDSGMRIVTEKMELEPIPYMGHVLVKVENDIKKISF